MSYMRLERQAPRPRALVPGKNEISIRRISVFDVDRTLTSYPTFSPFLIYAARRLSPVRLLMIPVVGLLMIAHKFGLLTRKRLKEIMQRLMLGTKVRRAVLEPIVRSFVARLSHSGLRPRALAAIELDRSQGREIILATAAPDFYARELAIEVGADALIATCGRWNNDNLVPEIDGENCYGYSKLKRLQEFVAGDNVSREQLHIRFYSDGASDLPCFQWADEGIAVNPTRRLKHLAERLGLMAVRWPRLDRSL